MPHIAAAAATIGLTVTVVEAILKRERAETLRPWTDNVNEKLRLELKTLATEVCVASPAAFRRMIFQKTPGALDLIGIFGEWLSSAEADGASRHSRVHRIRRLYEIDAEDDPLEAELSPVLGHAVASADRLRDVRDRNVNALSPILVRALDEFDHAVTSARLHLAFVSIADQPVELLTEIERGVVSAARDLAIAVQQVDSKPLDLPTHLLLTREHVDGQPSALSLSDAPTK